MATSLSSLCFAVSVSSSSSSSSTSLSSFNTKSFRNLTTSNCKSTSLGYNPLSSFSNRRKVLTVRATVLQDDEEKVKVEESFQPNSFPGDDRKGSASAEEAVENTSSSVLERWAIKVEQSVNIALTDSVIKILDVFYRDRDYARFFVLETIARVPYFAFMSVLHLYETFGWWRRADYLKVHFAESWNEMHHLLIMEELGGNSWWFDRFLAQHIAVFYYFMIVVMYMISPRMAYHFSECVEMHAFETYDKFLKLQGDELKKLPAPEVAVKYYTEGDLYLFENLYDVFLNIRDDEAEHCKTMKACQTHGNLRSPHSYQADDSHNIQNDDSGCIVPQADCEGIVDCLKKSATPPQTTMK
ncbi:ubiquinol oxidase 4, chloroplastic/chromoplastic-like isoform X2 [Papaver somniferum]|uniref:ubiquinol oxidase 4, chloroplastic/chromoplastic-like isoform X2 n=1 Tax=Papaver somniferum TaxID=3469 RepID=UPI000E6FCD82|nr:ubiquinol oxidase 4, chloroplastic/chromoplastic-like isoform X2 [Papaver somniferum]